MTKEEFELIKTHTVEGADILRSSLSDIEDDSWLSMAVEMAQYHHERWDGAGYPSGLSGEEIPLCARIMAVSDVFDALVSVRSYKMAFPFEDAMRILQEGAGAQFDARIIRVFEGAELDIRAIMTGHEKFIGSAVLIRRELFSAASIGQGSGPIGRNFRTRIPATLNA